MEGSAIGSAPASETTAPTPHQSANGSYPESATVSQRQRESWEPPVGPPGESIGTEAASSVSEGTECAHCEALGVSVAASCSGSGIMVSGTSSPRFNALVLPAPPDSPGISRSPSVYSASESSIPESVSSSFFFSSSAPGSPGRSHPGSYPSSHPHSDHEHEHEHEYDHDHEEHHTRVSEQGLIIPSLTLPDALRRPTPFGQTLGTLKLLVLGGQGAGKSFLTGLLLEDNEDVVDVGTWEDWYAGEEGAAGVCAYGKVLRASTDWLEQHDAFGLERFEPSKNVEIVELPGYSHDTDATELITRLKGIIEGPFRALHGVLHPETEPSGVVANLLSASSSPLYSALIFLLPSPPTPLDREIILAISSYIPLIVLPRLHGPHRGPKTNTASLSSAKLSRFRPASPVALRNGLFHSPETTNLLRSEAVDRFLKWREVERAVEEIWEGSSLWDPATTDNAGRMRRSLTKTSGITERRSTARRLAEKDWGRTQRDPQGSERRANEVKTEVWGKAKWEAEWMESHSQDVAKRMRQGTITQRNSRQATQDSESIYARKDIDEKHDSLPTTVDAPDVHSYSSRLGAREHPYMPFDPLHLPSLFFFSVSLLGPLKNRVGDSLKSVMEALNESHVRFALFGGFCVGLGLGVWIRTL